MGIADWPAGANLEFITTQNHRSAQKSAAKDRGEAEPVDAPALTDRIISPFIYNDVFENT